LLLLFNIIKLLNGDIDDKYLWAVVPYRVCDTQTSSPQSSVAGRELERNLESIREVTTKKRDELLRPLQHGCCCAVAAGWSSFADANTSLKLDQINTDWQVFFHVNINQCNIVVYIFCVGGCIDFCCTDALRSYSVS
jgi:hypothetical protein